MEWGSALFGSVLLLTGILSAINHRLIDGSNRWLKSIGTKQRPRDIEMNDTSILVGRILGTFVSVVGFFILYQAV